MAGKSKTKKTAKKSKATSSKETTATQQAKKQMWAVVLFAAGLLLAALTFIRGEAVWLWIHNFLFGMLGWSVYFLAPLMIYTAVIAARDKPLTAIKAKLWQVIILIILISSAIQIWAGLPDEGHFIDNVAALYESGKELRGGGLAGALLAVPLLLFTGDTGAKIIIILAIFVFAMLITGSSLISLYHHLRRPVEGIGEAYAEAVEYQRERHDERTARREMQADEAPETKRRRFFSFDVDISEDTEPGDPLPGAEPAMEQEPAWESTPDPFSFPIPEPEPFPEPEPVIPAHLELPDEPEDANASDFSFPILQPDRPVEYISPDEFLPETESAGEAETAPERRAHPLEEEILRAEQQTDDGEMGNMDGRFFTPEPIASEIPPTEMALFDGQETVPDVEPPLDADAPAEQEEGGGIHSMPNTAQGTLPGEPSAQYQHPPVDLLSVPVAVSTEDINDELKGNAQKLEDTLRSFGVQTRIIGVSRGPAVTRYELQPSAGVKISKITGLADDIALNLAAAGIRIEAPIPNKAAVGIEVPNKVVSTVSIREIIDSADFRDASSSLTVALGKDIAGKTTLADLGRMPHVLIAGSTGSGKSVCINSIIISLLYKSSPDEVKLLMVDPKVVELGIYNGIPHLLVPVVTDPKKAAGALNWAVGEMLRRYTTFADNSVRDLAGYNRLAIGHPDLQPLPKIVIIIDELADLMMAAPGDVEDAICRLAQMARAAGMHLVIATQRPSVDVITGVIKANIPSRIAFAVSSAVDSRTILDTGGAEKLLGRGDMLFYPVGAAKPVRVQGCFVTDGEVEKVVDFVKQGEPAAYDSDIAEQIDSHVVVEKGKGKAARENPGGGFDDEDEMLPAAIECVVEMGQASTSALQRRLKLGYARAARIIDQLEEKGIVGPFEGSKPRQVLISKERWMEMKLSGAEDSARGHAARSDEDFPPFDL